MIKIKSNVLKYGIKQIGSNDYSYDIVGTLFDNRNIIKDTRDDFFEPNDTVLFNPFLLKNMDRAVECVKHHLENNHNIHILSDEDADGYTSNSVLLSLIIRLKKEMNSKSQITWSVHEKKTHGIKIEELKNYKFNLLLMADGGSNDFQQHHYYNQNGVDIVMLDHHQCETHSYSEKTIVVNPQLDDYPNKELSGAGVVYKFIQAISGIDVANEYSELLAIGIIADMMELKNLETRYIVKEGLKRLKHPLIKDILEFKKIKSPKISDISFYVAPYINAMTRIGNVQQKSKMFESLYDPYKPIINFNSFGNKKKNGFSNNYIYQDTLKELLDIKEKQDLMQNEQVSYLQNQINENDKINICIMNEQSLIKGMVANNISSETMKPTVVVEIKDRDGQGSGRGFFATTDDFKRDVKESNLIYFAEGHGNAFGIKFAYDKIDEIKKYFNKLYEEINYQYSVDFVIPSNELTNQLCNKIESLKHEFGNGFEEPLFFIKDIPIENYWVNVPKNTVLKTVHRDIEFVLFNPTDEDLSILVDGIKINAIGRLGINEFLGKKTGQFIIDKYEVNELKQKVEMWW